jgi:cytochrome P450
VRTDTFDLDRHKPGRLGQAILNFVMEHAIPGFFALLREIAPVWRIPRTNIVIVTRFDDVQEICLRHAEFPVPYQSKVDKLGWHPPFLLALPDGDEYQRILREVHQLWSDQDLGRVREIAREASERALQEAGGRIDAIQSLMVPVVLAVLERYYGIAIPPADRQACIDGAMHTAGFLFGPQSDSAEKVAVARQAIAGVWKVIDAAIAESRLTPKPEDTIIGRCHAQGITSDANLRSYLMGMIVGYLPTNTNANGRVLKVLLNHPIAWRAAVDAARAGDHAGLLAALHEALRLEYILPGLWRRATARLTLGEGTAQPRTIDAGSLVYISFMAAMKDRRRVRNPYAFDHRRSPDVNMIYGYQFHWCVGARISDAMMQGIFMALMRRAPRAAGPLRMKGNFPWNQWVSYAG